MDKSLHSNQNIFSLKRPYVIGISGCTGSGKSFVCDKIKEKVTEIFGTTTGNVVIIHQDCRYWGEKDNKNKIIKNFDVPSALDMEGLTNDIADLRSGKSVQCPIYDFTTHSRKKETEILYPAKIIIVEGILIFTYEELLKLCDKKIFVTASELVRFIRRQSRDVEIRGRTADQVLKIWMTDIRESERDYILPSSRHANLLVENDRDGHYENLDILLDHITTKINDFDSFIPKPIQSKPSIGNLKNLINSFDEIELFKLKKYLDKKILEKKSQNNFILYNDC